MGANMRVQFTIRRETCTTLRTDVLGVFAMVTWLTNVIRSATAVHLGHQVLLGAKGFETDAACVEARLDLEMVFAMHL